MLFGILNIPLCCEAYDQHQGCASCSEGCWLQPQPCPAAKILTLNSSTQQICLFGFMPTTICKYISNSLVIAFQLKTFYPQWHSFHLSFWKRAQIHFRICPALLLWVGGGSFSDVVNSQLKRVLYIICLHYAYLSRLFGKACSVNSCSNINITKT